MLLIPPTVVLGALLGIVLWGPLWWWNAQLFTPSTVYAVGYEEDRFQSVAAGMTLNEVLKRVGQPLRRFQMDNVTFLVYSDIGRYTSHWEKAYHQRWIAIGNDGGVVHIFSRLITTDHNPIAPLPLRASFP